MATPRRPLGEISGNGGRRKVLTPIQRVTFHGMYLAGVLCYDIRHTRSAALNRPRYHEFGREKGVRYLTETLRKTSFHLFLRRDSSCSDSSTCEEYIIVEIVKHRVRCCPLAVSCRFVSNADKGLRTQEWNANVDIHNSFQSARTCVSEKLPRSGGKSSTYRISNIYLSLNLQLSTGTHTHR